VRRGFVLRVYENSLSLAFALLFVASFALHAATGEYNEELMAHGQPAASVAEYVAAAQFRFESFQNCRASSCRWRPWWG
jgi:hypothetical protein